MRSAGQPHDCSRPSREAVDAKALHGAVPQRRVALDERPTAQFVTLAAPLAVTVQGSPAGRPRRNTLALGCSGDRSLSGRRTVDKIRPAHAACVRWLSIYPRFRRSLTWSELAARPRACLSWLARGCALTGPTTQAGISTSLLMSFKTARALGGRAAGDSWLLVNGRRSVP